MRSLLAVLSVVALLGACSPAGEMDDDATPLAVETPTEPAAVDDRTEPERSTPTPQPRGASPAQPTVPAEPTPDGNVATPTDPTPQLDDPLALPGLGAPGVPEDPAEVAEIITAAERAIRDPNRAPESLAAAGHWQQVIYRELGHDPDRLDPVLAHVPEDLHGVVRDNVFAGARLFEMHSPRDPDEPVEIRELPGWRFAAPPPADELRSHYAEAEAATGVHWSYLAAIHLVETRMGRIRGTSVAGAQGPMQFMPATWEEWGEGDVNDPGDAILAAARYLRWGGMPGDVDGAIFRYNRDARYVDAVRTYAEQMQADERAYYGYYHWQVYYFTGAQNVWLPAGYDGSGDGGEPVPGTIGG